MFSVCFIVFELFLFFFFFFKQKTAYEMRISDWSSDVCSSDLIDKGAVVPALQLGHRVAQRIQEQIVGGQDIALQVELDGRLRFVQRIDEIGRASCRERVCPYV